MRVFSFGDFELDASRFELRRAGSPVQVQPRVLRLLLLLVAERQRVVSAEELSRALWPDTTVGAGSLRRAVLGARQALGEAADSNSSIRTVRGLGYQFVQPVRTSTGAWTARPVPSLPLRPAERAFVGHGRAWMQLRSNLDAALQGATRCVLLTGGLGLGKSRTLDELGAEAQARGAQSWLARCSAEEGAPAFWPFIQVLRAALRDRGDEPLRSAAGDFDAEMARGLRELRWALADVSALPAEALGSGQFRVFDSVAMWIERACRQQPVLIGFDDLQHADPATLHLLAFLLRQVRHAPLMIVATFRREASDTREPLRSLDEFLRDAPACCVELEGLSRSELARYLELAAGAPPPNDVLERVHEQTAGSPLLVRKLVDGWLCTAAAGALDWTRLPSADQRAVGSWLSAAASKWRTSSQPAIAALEPCDERTLGMTGR